MARRSKPARLQQLAVELFVSDLERSIAFYRRLGFRLARREERFCVLTREGRQLFLAQEAGAAGNVRVMVGDVDRYRELARKLGAPILSEVADRYYGLRDFTMADPDGFGVRFASPLRRAASRAGAAPRRPAPSSKPRP